MSDQPREGPDRKGPLDTPGLPGGMPGGAAPEGGQPVEEERDPYRPRPDLLEIPEILREKPSTAPLEKPKSTTASLIEMGKAWGLAFDFVFSIIGGFALGWLFDYWRGTGPWGAIIGLGIGFVTAFIRIIRNTTKAERREREGKEREARERAAAAAGSGGRSPSAKR